LSREAKKSKTRWSGIQKFSTRRKGSDPSFCKSEEINVTRFSKIRNSSEFQRIKERTDVKSTHTERVGGRTRIEMNITT